ncbi:hypothetical protein AB0K16_53100 [Nonomuraea jabiensis]|uniref:hypothetical protein n=1 Tax=Nonomuraea jabiensis TaxID=882448 RepID=UPI00341C6DD4
MTLTRLLEGLRCASCGALDALCLDLTRALVECRECGQTALIVTDTDEGRSL